MNGTSFNFGRDAAASSPLATPSAPSTSAVLNSKRSYADMRFREDDDEQAKSKARTSNIKELPQANLVDEGHGALHVAMGTGVAHARAQDEAHSSCIGTPLSFPAN